MASRSLFTVLYLDEQEQEQILEVPAYSGEQALLLASEFCPSERIVNVDCTSRHYQPAYIGTMG